MAHIGATVVRIPSGNDSHPGTALLMITGSMVVIDLITWLVLTHSKSSIPITRQSDHYQCLNELVTINLITSILSCQIVITLGQDLNSLLISL